MARAQLTAKAPTASRARRCAIEADRGKAIGKEAGTPIPDVEPQGLDVAILTAPSVFCRRSCTRARLLSALRRGCFRGRLGSAAGQRGVAPAEVQQLLVAAALDDAPCV